MSAIDGVAWTLARLDDLPPRALYALLQLRSEVFIVEQACAFQDLDGSDGHALHLMGHIEEHLVAYARCFGPGVKFPQASLGRVATRGSARGNGLGHALLVRAMASVGEQWGVQPIRVGAQARLQMFYRSHGFVDMALPYVEDGIEHLEMLWQP